MGPHTPPNAYNANLRGVNEGNLRAIIGGMAGDYWPPNGRQEQGRERVPGASVSVRREIVSVRREIRRLKFRVTTSPKKSRCCYLFRGDTKKRKKTAVFSLTIKGILTNLINMVK